MNRSRPSSRASTFASRETPLGPDDHGVGNPAPFPASFSFVTPFWSRTSSFPLRTEPQSNQMARIDTFFKRMVQVEASDLHLTTGLQPYFRLHGDMVPITGTPPTTAEEMRELLFEIAPIRNQEEFENDNDTDFAYELEGEARFRVNLFRDMSGPGAVCRLIPSEILTAEKLGLPDAVKSLCRLSKGLVLVTGPTGSGKSTTLAAMVDSINKTRSEHIITIEDPVEFVHPNQKCLVHQREVGRHTNSFKRALRAALREDPDVILVGELRDLETIEIAIETAETGHLVFGTLHTTTAASTVDRIIDQFPEGRQAQIRTMLAGSLKGVIAQTLCRKVGGGRCAALEVMIGTKAISSLIREGKTHQLPSQIQTGSKVGMRLMNDSLVELVKAGQVEAMEAYYKSIDKESFLSELNHAGIHFDPHDVSVDRTEPTPVGHGETPGGAGLDTKAMPPTPAAPEPDPALPSASAPPSPYPPKKPVAGGDLGDSFEQFRRKKRGQ